MFSPVVFKGIHSVTTGSRFLFFGGGNAKASGPVLRATGDQTEASQDDERRQSAQCALRQRQLRRNSSRSRNRYLFAGITLTSEGINFMFLGEDQS